MTPQEENARIQQQVNEELRAYSEAQRIATKETEKAGEVEAKVAGLTATGLQILEKLYAAQLQYTLAMAKGQKGAAQFNNGIDAMTEATQIAAVALSLLVPGGPLIKGLVAGLTFLGTQAMKTAAEMQKAANEQADATYKAFQAFSKAGATGTDGLKGFFNDVNRMRLNVHQLDAMAGVIANSAKEMSAMGGTVYKARGQFADLVQNMGDFETGMLNLGMSYDDQAEAAMGYMKLQSTLSQGQQKDYGKLSGGMKKYLQETEALARVTGLSRKEQEAVQEKMLAQQRFGAKVQELRDNGQNEAADLLVSQMKKYAAKGDMYAQAFADSSTGMLTSEAAIKGNMSSMGKIMEEATGIASGRIKTEQEANESFQGTMGAVKDVTKSMNMLYQAGVGEDFLLPLKEGTEIIKGANQDFAKQIAEAGEQVEQLINSTDEVDDQLKRYNALIKGQNDEMLALQRSLNGSFTAAGVGLDGFTSILEKTGKIIMELAKKAFEVLGLIDKDKEREASLGAERVQSEMSGASGEVGMAMDQGQSTMSAAPETVKSTKEMGFFDRLLVGEENIKKREAAEAAGQTPAQAAAATTMPASRTTANLMQSSVGLDAKPPAPAVPPAPTSSTASNQSVQGTLKMGKPDGPIQFNGKNVNPGEPEYKAASKALIASQKNIADAEARFDDRFSRAENAPAPAKPTAAPAPGGKPPAPAPAPGGKPPAPASIRANQQDLAKSGLTIKKGDVQAPGSTISSELIELAKKIQGSVPGFQYFSGFNDRYHQEESPNSLHTQGMAADFVLDRKPSRKEGKELTALLKSLGATKAIDEYNSPSAKATAGHMHVEIAKMTGQGIQAAAGGVFDGPKSGYAATLHGMEAVIPLKDGAVPVSMSQEFNMTATNLGELVSIMKSNVDMQASMLAVLDEMRRSQNTTADNTGRMVAYASN